MIRTFLLKLTALAALTCALQGLVYFAQMRTSLRLPSRIESIYQTLYDKPDVLYLGDSTLTAMASRDSVRKTTPQFLQDLLPAVRIGMIQGAAYHSGVYYAVCKLLVRRGYHNTTLIIPINPRSFPAAWDLQPGYQFDREIKFLEHDSLLLRVFCKAALIFKVFKTATITDEEFRRLPVYEGGRVIGSAGEFEAGKGRTSDERIKNMMRYFYMADITARHRKVAAFRELARLLKREHMKAVFYVTPVDYRRGGQYLGPVFPARLRHNIAVVRSVIEAEGYPVMDLSEALPPEQFMWKEDEVYPSEHLRDTGREFIARRLAGKIRSF